jgi:protein KRI1
VAGTASLPFSVDALDEDFDPEAHEAAMGAAFGDAYYGEEEEEGEGALLEKPQFGDMDEELQALLTGQAAGTGGYAAAARRAAARPDAGGGDDSGSGSEEEEEDAAAAGAGGGAAAADGAAEGEDGRFSKRAMKKWRRCEHTRTHTHAHTLLCPSSCPVRSHFPPLSCPCSALSAKMEEYYALDCEDFVAGLPCRFRYKTVAPDKYGLKTEEVLTLSDKELNQVVSLKKLAPYRDADAKPRRARARGRCRWLFVVSGVCADRACVCARAGMAASASARRRRWRGCTRRSAAAAARCVLSCIRVICVSRLRRCIFMCKG